MAVEPAGWSRLDARIRLDGHLDLDPGRGRVTRYPSLVSRMVTNERGSTAASWTRSVMPSGQRVIGSHDHHAPSASIASRTGWVR
jgi:hypothetical protein